MTKTIILIRHAETDSGERKDFLSEKGRVDAFEFKVPENLPKIRLIGGTDIPRSYVTAGLIVDGNCISNATFLASDPRFGSFDAVISQNFNFKKFKELTESGDCKIKALKKTIDTADYSYLCSQIIQGLREVFTKLNDGESTILVSHDPFVPMAIEAISGKEFNQECPFLGYVIFTAHEDKEWLIDVHF